MIFLMLLIIPIFAYASIEARLFGEYFITPQDSLIFSGVVLGLFFFNIFYQIFYKKKSVKATLLFNFTFVKADIAIKVFYRIYFVCFVCISIVQKIYWPLFFCLFIIILIFAMFPNVKAYFKPVEIEAVKLRVGYQTEWTLYYYTSHFVKILFLMSSMCFMVFPHLNGNYYACFTEELCSINI